MARFEWAQVVAFDGEAKPALAADDLLGADPAKLRLAMQPYLTLLNLQYPLDDFVLAVKKRNRAMRSEASNAMDDHRKERAATRPRVPNPGQIFVAVHRFENALYYKRLLPAQYRLLTALTQATTLEQACETALADEQDDALAGRITEWFQTWMELGWFCRRE
ncbi:MAG TPA: hypothetical protein VLJ39_07035 [Tepidisphaeraceae bacterium]|nr:hypothetical protein [Tepidisphaeraceae bacterium]